MSRNIWLITMLFVSVTAFASENGYKLREEGVTYKAKTNGFVVVRLESSVTSLDSRVVYAHGLVDGELVASASAVDNFVPDVISSPIQSFTMPVRKGSKWQVMRAGGGGTLEVRLVQVQVPFALSGDQTTQGQSTNLFQPGFIASLIPPKKFRCGVHEG